MLSRNIYSCSVVLLSLLTLGLNKLSFAKEENIENIYIQSWKWKIGIGAGSGIFDSGIYFDPRKEDLTFHSLDLKGYENINRPALLLNCTLGLSKTITIEIDYNRTSLPQEVNRNYYIDYMDTSIAVFYTHRFIIRYFSMDLRYNSINNSSVIPYFDIGLTSCNGKFDLMNNAEINVNGRNIMIKEYFKWINYHKLGCNFSIGANYLINKKLSVFNELRAYLIGQSPVIVKDKKLYINNGGTRFVIGLRYFLR